MDLLIIGNGFEINFNQNLKDFNRNFKDWIDKFDTDNNDENLNITFENIINYLKFHQEIAENKINYDLLYKCMIELHNWFQPVQEDCILEKELYKMGKNYQFIA